MTLNRKDLLAGAIFIAIGLAFAIDALIELPLGTAFRMGPGYFPLVLAGLLMLLGAGIIVGGIGVQTPAPRVPPRPAGPRPTGVQGALARLGPWRGPLLILSAPVIFGFGIQPVGLIPSLALAIFVAAFASDRVSPRFALVMTVLLTAFCYVVFVIGLQVPVRLYGPWLDPLFAGFGAR